MRRDHTYLACQPQKGAVIAELLQQVGDSGHRATANAALLHPEAHCTGEAGPRRSAGICGREWGRCGCGHPTWKTGRGATGGVWLHWRRRLLGGCSICGTPVSRSGAKKLNVNKQ